MCSSVLNDELVGYEKCLFIYSAVGKCRTTLKTAVWMGSLKTIHLKNQIVNLYVAVFNNII